MQREFQKNQPILSQVPEDEVQTLIANRPGVISKASVLRNNLIPLSVL